ncbi:MAG: VWA domain-containing protein [Gammaproteobacteria bacterium]|nr:VWA domain-containing protein [Gammaproteobacteria bacterium]
MRKTAGLLFLFCSYLLLTSCSEPVSHNRAVYMLLDTSGTYTQQIDKAKGIVKYLLGILSPGDSLALARIDSGSFSEKDIIAKITFDLRPSKANSQKRAFLEAVDQFSSQVKGSSYTDITGGMLQAIEYLNETGAGEKYILVFSDMKEEIKKGQIRDFPITFDGIKVTALNVTKLRSDNVDPREYMKRVEAWSKRVQDGGGQWRVMNDLDRLNTLLE